MPHNTQAPRQGTHRLLDILDKDITTSTPRATRHTHKGTQALREKPSVVRHNTRNKLRQRYSCTDHPYSRKHAPPTGPRLAHTHCHKHHSSHRNPQGHRNTQCHGYLFTHMYVRTHTSCRNTKECTHIQRGSLIPHSPPLAKSGASGHPDHRL